MSDIGQLREEFPGWIIRERWITVASGPDARMIMAVKDGFQFFAHDTGEIKACIMQQEAWDSYFPGLTVVPPPE